MSTPRQSAKKGSAQPSAQIIYRKPLNLMSPIEGRVWIESMLDRLVKKQAREKAYLDRRKARKVHTPTDEAYEGDQVLEDELIGLLKKLLEEISDI